MPARVGVSAEEDGEGRLSDGERNGMKPQRIQRKRTKGYDMQAESMALNGLPAVSVCRPGKWGNHFSVMWSPERAEFYVWNTLANQSSILFHSKRAAAEEACVSFRFFLERKYREELSTHALPLRGKNLACFCPLDMPCHADIWIEIANR